jgi:8-oxo-dGTP pyrophosphatase MutT (NUDIX family)
MARIETVAIVYRHPRILLGMKKNKLGAGRYNGFGGGMEVADRDIYDTAIRETKEESGITLLDPERMGRILFSFQSDEQDHDVHFFRARRYLGTPRETDEMAPEWFNIQDIPYDRMWSDDKYWLPLLLEDKRFLGEFLFNSKHQIVRHRFKEFDKKGRFESSLSELLLYE